MRNEFLKFIALALPEKQPVSQPRKSETFKGFFTVLPSQNFSID